MPKTFPRGDPDGDLAVLNNYAIRQHFARDKAEVDSMLPGGFTLHNLTNGEIELVAGEEVLRCYLAKIDQDYTALIIDDYHPDDDANLRVDEVGNVLNPEDDDAQG